MRLSPSPVQRALAVEPPSASAGARFDAATVFHRSPVEPPPHDAASPAGAAMPRRLSLLLELVNGRRTMREYRDLLPRHRDLDGDFAHLMAAGLVDLPDARSTPAAAIAAR